MTSFPFVTGVGGTDRLLSEEDVRPILDEAFAQLDFTDKRLLVHSSGRTRIPACSFFGKTRIPACSFFR